MNNQRWNRRVWASCAAFDGVESGNDRQSIYQPQDAVMETNRCRALPTGWPAFVLSGSVLLLCMGVAHAASADQNWPQWRGPHGTGVAPHGDPPIEWSETKNVKWKAKIPGSGSATPVIWDNQVFIQTAIPTGRKIEPPAQAPDSGTAAADPSEQNQPARRGRGGGFGGGQKPTEVYQFAILCLDRQTGKALWQQIAREEVPHEGYRQGDGSFASASGVTDGSHVFAYFGSRGLYCYDLNGKLQWTQDFGDMRTALGFGEGSSPALYQDTLIVNWDHEGEDFIVALNKETGKELWRQTRDERTSWSTPLVVEHDGKAQVITTATGKIRSYDVATGKLIWECAGLTRNVIPSPVADNDTVYCTSGFQGNALLAIRLSRTGDLTDSDAIVWRHNKSTPYVPSPLLYGGKLYFFASNNGVLSCFNARTGQALIDAERLEAVPGVYASPVGASGRVYLVGRNGAAVVIKQSDKLEVLATNQLEEKFDASPAIVGKEVFLRGKENLYCIAEK
jgi:outer membrane protein assembly factor BamB